MTAARVLISVAAVLTFSGWALAQVPASSAPVPTSAAATAPPATSVAPPAASATTPTASATEANPPPQPSTGYQEVTGSRESAPPPPPQTPVAGKPGAVYEPPLPASYAAIEPPLPPVPKHVAPLTSLWVGGKLGWAFPSGEAWRDGRWIDNTAYILESRPFADFATSGPKTELNVGARLGRRYNVFAHWEYANLGTGEALPDDLGGQNRGHMNFLGGGFRFSSDPDEVGVLVEAVIGYRGFTASWQNGTELEAVDSFLNTRLSFGADIRLSPLLSLSPMLGLSGGFFEEVTWKFADGTTANALSDFDTFAQHTVITLDLGAHFDVIRSAR
jgi:hypothetical protein